MGSQAPEAEGRLLGVWGAGPLSEKEGSEEAGHSPAKTPPKLVFGASLILNYLFDDLDRHEIAQRSFFGPSGGKSGAADPFSILPRSIFEFF